jgi:hypothetical protein
VRRLKETGAAAAAGAREDEGILLMRKRFPQIVLSTLAGGAGLVGLVGTLEQLNPALQGATDHAINTSVCALFAAFVLAWFHGEKGTQTAPLLERWILAVIALVWIGVSVLLFMRP